MPKYTSPTFFYPKQQEIFDSKAREVYVIASNKVGKTLCLGLWLNEKILLGKPNGKYCWLSPHAKTSTVGFDLMSKIIMQSNYYKSLKDIKHPNRFKFISSHPQKITYPNGNIVEFLQGENPKAIWGEQYRHSVIDEATRLKQVIIDTPDGGMQVYCEAYAALKSTMRITRGQIKGISNPTTSNNWFYKKYLKAKTDDNPDTESFHLNCLDAVEAGFLPQKEVDDAKKYEIPFIFTRDWMGLVPEFETCVFLSEEVMRCIDNDIVEDIKKVAYVGVDLGYTTNNKSDWTVCAGFNKKMQMVFFKRFKAEGQDLVDKLVPYINNRPGYIDATCGGNTIYKMLLPHCPNLKPFVFNNKNKCDTIEILSHYIKTGKISFKNNDTVISELLGYEVELGANGKAFYNNGKNAAHDDSVIAMGLAVLMAKDMGDVKSYSYDIIEIHDSDDSDDGWIDIDTEDNDFSFNDYNF